MATGGVAKALHFKEANLVKAASEDVNYVAIVGSPFREVIIELSGVSKMALSRRLAAEQGINYLQCLLVVLDVIPVDVMMGPNGLSELRANNHARSFSSRPAREQHNSATSILER